MIYILLTLLILMLIAVALVLYSTNILQTSNYEFANTKIPKEFDDFKIAQLSDFHCTKSTILKNSLVKKLKAEKPDIIVITGDLVDSRRLYVDCSMEFIKRIIGIAPIYFVTGNHESGIDDYETLIEPKLRNLGIIILDNKCLYINKENSKIEISGINDPGHYINEYKSTIELNVLTDEKVAECINELPTDNNCYRVLLSHRPESFDIYKKEGFDLVFTGHCHGGQIALPFIGAILAPNQGFFPKYSRKYHKENNTTMVISRGIGTSRMPIRLFCNPELVIVKLKHKYPER